MQFNSSSCLLISKVLFITMGYLYIGYGLTYYAITQNSIAYVMNFFDSDNESIIQGFINAALPIGAAIAALLSSTIVNKLRYRQTFIIVDVIGIIIAMLFSINDIYILILCRLFQGFITGMNSSLVIQYIYHFVPIQNVGIYVGLAPCLMMMGLALGFAAQWIFLTVDPTEYNSSIEYGPFGFNNWRVMFLLTAVPCFIRAFGVFAFISSDLPFEELKAGDEEKARNQIQSSHSSNKSDDEINNLIEIIKQNQKEENQKLCDLFNFKYRKSMIICIIISILQQFAGINAVNFYAGVIVGAMTNNNNTLINLTNVMGGVVSMFASIFSSMMINKVGRRVILLVGNAFCFISLTLICIIIPMQESNLETVHFKIANLTSLFIYIISFSLSLGPVFWVYISEVLPTKGISFVTFLNWVSCAVVAQIFPIIVKQMSLVYNFAIFAVVCFLLEVIIYVYVFETKGLNKLEIQTQFNKNKQNYVDLSD